MTNKANQELAERLSDDAIKLAFGWFSFGSKATVTSHPPHANMKANEGALAELIEAGFITHDHENDPRFGIDRHHYKGTDAINNLLQSGRAKALILRTLKEQPNGQ